MTARAVLTALTDTGACIAFTVLVGLTAAADADLGTPPVPLDVMAGVYAGAALGVTP